jgi:hypothetical protein
MANDEPTDKPECLGCDQPIDDGTGRSLDGYNTSVCEQCWNELTVFQKILLRTLTGCAFDEGGGLNTAVEIQTIDKTLRKMFQIQHGHDADGICGECDPIAWEQRRKRKAEIAAARKESDELKNKKGGGK